MTADVLFVYKVVIYIHTASLALPWWPQCTVQTFISSYVTGLGTLHICKCIEWYYKFKTSLFWEL